MRGHGRGERGDVRTRAIEYGEGLGIRSEVRLHDLLQSGGVDVFAVGDLVPAVGLGYCREDLRVSARVIVAGETTDVDIV